MIRLKKQNRHNQTWSGKMPLKEKIKEYVDDQYKFYAFYPYDVEVDGKLYSYDEYMAIIHPEVII